VVNWISKIEDHFKNISYSDMDIGQLENYLANTDLNEVQKDSFLRFWRINKQKIRDSLRTKSVFSKTLNKFSWRVDLKSTAKNATESVNEPTAIVELTLQSNNTVNDSQIIRFEMNAEQMNQTLLQMKAVQDLIQKISQIR